MGLGSGLEPRAGTWVRLGLGLGFRTRIGVGVRVRARVRVRVRVSALGLAAHALAGRGDVLDMAAVAADDLGCGG